MRRSLIDLARDLQVGAEEAERRIRAANEPYKLEILQVRVQGGGGRREAGLKLFMKYRSCSARVPRC